MGYFGSKATSGLCQPLIAMIPPHDTYIETHLGGGAIMKRKPAALRNIGIDRDARALDAFECDYRVELVHGCAHRYLAEFEFQGSELVYSDPPYLKRTRTSRRRYRFDYEEADHVALLELLKGVPCQVMVSGYPSTLYEERLRGWRSVEWQVMNQDGVRTEKLWFNFAPERLHWARYAGKNFTDRQRIKRKAQSWGRRYAALPAARAPRGARGDDGGRGRALGPWRRSTRRRCAQSSTRSRHGSRRCAPRARCPPRAAPSSTPC